jgi:hypothetical protein
VRKLTFFLAAVFSVLFAEKALCRGTTFSVEPESFNCFRYEEIRVEGPIERSIRTGRFLSVDPVLDGKKALVQPQRWNRYCYVENNPINRIDPDGRQSFTGAEYIVGFRDKSPEQIKKESAATRNGFLAGIAIGLTRSICPGPSRPRDHLGTRESQSRGREAAIVKWESY